MAFAFILNEIKQIGEKNNQSEIINFSLTDFFSIHIFDKINTVDKKLSTDYLFSKIFGVAFKIFDDQILFTFL